MADEYHGAANAIELSSRSDFALPRARSLVAAIERSRDYSIVRLQRQADSASEHIVVDVIVDQVPPKNIYGIRYRERLAFVVPDDPQKLVEVRALRKDFPILLHQNQTVPGDAPSLCLYFEPTASVLRTWTPQNFLRRVQWWLEKSANGELHPADQPVERLFFVSKYELVLPWNFAELLKDPNRAFRIVVRARRVGGATTFYLVDAGIKVERDELRAEYIELELPPVVHGVIERTPTNLGQLHDQLRDRGVDLFTPFKTALSKRVGQQGARAPSDDRFTIVLLHIPISRTAGAAAETVHRRAFLIDAGPLKLGEEIGALFQHEKTYFNAVGVLSAPDKTEWRSREVESIEILRENDVAAARQQSGIAEPGPSGVLIGAGSLGSAMLNLWGRSGWGRWTVIDKDHVKPHNLSRHIAYTQQIGEPKALVVASLHKAAIGDSELTAVVGDATDLGKKEIVTPLRAASLVVDCSTTLEYPRKASVAADLPRHISAFITPNGNSAVLLAEDSERKMRLRSLEAQYYRALIQNDWGKKHLVGNLGTFWSGASCRDISIVLPYSMITVHAGTLADHVRLAANQTDALIRIWERDPSTGAIAIHDTKPLAENRMRFGALDLFIDAGVEQQLRPLRNAALPNETGGVLLGYYDFSVNAVVVVCGLPAPPDSKSTPGMFERGTSGLADDVNEATDRTAGVVGYIGEWHSHPPNHSATPSGHDLFQLLHLAFGMSDDGLPALQLIIGEHDIRLLQGRVPS